MILYTLLCAICRDRLLDVPSCTHSTVLVSITQWISSCSNGHGGLCERFVVRSRSRNMLASKDTDWLEQGCCVPHWP